MRRPLPPVLTLGLAVIATLTTVAVPGGDVLGSPAHWIGLPFTAAGVATAVAGSRQFERVGTNTKTVDRPDVLVDNGLFAFSRTRCISGSPWP